MSNNGNITTDNFTRINIFNFCKNKAYSNNDNYSLNDGYYYFNFISRINLNY